jgi:hypothetical protein
MVVNRHKYFRWTKRTAFLTTMYVVVVPATLGYFGYITDVSSTRRSVEARVVDATWLMLGRASGISAERGGVTPSLSFRAVEKGLERKMAVCIYHSECRASQRSCEVEGMNFSMFHRVQLSVNLVSMFYLSSD